MPFRTLFCLFQFRLDGPERNFALHEHRNAPFVLGQPDENAALGVENAVTVEHGFDLDRIHRTDSRLQLFLAVNQHLKFVTLLAAHRRKTGGIPHRKRHRPHVVERRHNAVLHALDGDRGIGGALDLAGLRVGKHRIRKPRLLALAVEPDDGGVVERSLVEVLAEDFRHEPLVADTGIDRIEHGVDSGNGAVTLREREKLRLAARQGFHLERSLASRNRAPTETEGQFFALHPRSLDLRQVGLAGKTHSHKESHERGHLGVHLDVSPKHLAD